MVKFRVLLNQQKSTVQQAIREQQACLLSVIVLCILSGNKNGNNVHVILERTDNIQVTNITFNYNRFSIATKGSLKSVGRFRIQLLLEDNTWSTRYNTPKNYRYSDTSTDWTLVNLNFTVENYGIKVFYDQIDSAHADMCFSIITVTHSIF